jgi:hypothetical protein
MTNEEACRDVKVAGPDKHLESYQAIQEISQIVTSLDDLLGRITGPRPPETGVGKELREDPTLSEFLNGAAGDIRNKLDSAHQLIARINEELF